MVKMPIVDSLTIEYLIPENIKKLFTYDFLVDFKQSLDFMFKYVGYKEEDKTYWGMYNYLESTGGWHDALMISCRNFKYHDLISYHSSLPWYDSDLFDDELCRIMVEKKVIEEGIYTDYEPYIISSEESLEDIEPFFTDEELNNINQRLFNENEKINEEENKKNKIRKFEATSYD
jgi:hypothetical protein